MYQKTKVYILGLLYENNEPSLTRFIVFTAFLAFLVGSAYLLVKGQSWDGYSTFATATAGGGIGGQVANKLMNLTKASPADQPYIKNNVGGNQ